MFNIRKKMANAIFFLYHHFDNQEVTTTKIPLTTKDIFNKIYLLVIYCKTGTVLFLKTLQDSLIICEYLFIRCIKN